LIKEIKRYPMKLRPDHTLERVIAGGRLELLARARTSFLT